MNKYYYVAGILFRLINFTAVIAVCIFWYRRSVRFTMNELRDKKNKKQQELQQQNNQLTLDQHALQVHNDEQEIESKQLLANIHAWRSVVEQSIKSELQERDALHDKALIRADKQKKQWELLALQQAVLGPALKNAQRLLLEKYSNQKKGVSYVHAIMDELKTPRS